ncbi:MAG: SDR family oxidoreductase [Gemmatimonadota bacterium]
MPKSLKDQVIVITGASSGIGLATAIDAARAGARVVLAARNHRDLETAVAEIEREGGDALAVPVDVADFAQVQALANRTIEQYGRIDTWINNAAVSSFGLFKDQEVEEYRRIMEVNFLGQVHGAKAALPHLEQTAGALICVGSTLSDRGVPYQGAYCASKHALKGWLDALRVELLHERSRVRVTLVKPSSINTPLFNKARTHLGVMPQPIMPVYDVSLAVEGILRAATGNERDVFVGGGGKALSTAERISPKLVDMHQLKTGFTAQKSKWAKSAAAPNNLYEPVAYDGGISGDFLDDLKRRSPYQRVDAHVVASSLTAAVVLGLAAAGLRHKRTRTGSLLLGGLALAFAGKAVLAATWEH